MSAELKPSALSKSVMAIGTALALLVCASYVVRYFVPPDLESVLSHSYEYSGKTIWLTGTVETPLGLLGYGTFVLRNHGRTIRVITDAGLPNEGLEIVVSGVFRQGVSFNGTKGAFLFAGDTDKLTHIQ